MLSVECMEKFPKEFILIIQTKKVNFTNVEFPHITPPPKKKSKKSLLKNLQI
jgi:hypothetical protein